MLLLLLLLLALGVGADACLKGNSPERSRASSPSQRVLTCVYVCVRCVCVGVVCVCRLGLAPLKREPS